MQQEPRLLDLNGKQAVPYQIHAVFSLTFRVRQHNLCTKGQAGIADVCGKFIDFPDIIRGIGDKGSGQHEHHHEIDNGMDGFCGFPFDKPCVGNVKPLEQPIAGVQTISVPEVVLKQGSRYSVVITNSGIEKISFGVEAKSSYGNWFTCTAGIETGQTFYKGASETARWTDGKTKNWTARIKAHTRTLNQSWVPDTPVFQVKAYNSGYNLISWEKVSGATGYYVYRKPAAGGKWSKIADVGTSELKYKDSKVTANASYRYTVKAYYEASGKRYSGKYKTGDVIKAAPAVQKVTSVKSEKNGIRIRWKPQKKCDGYYIYRKKKGGSYQLIKKISNGNSSSYLDKKAQKGVSYYYAVKAYVKEPYGNTYSKYKSSSAVKRK